MTLTDPLRRAQRSLIFTGAGSGIPDFRGPQGVWTRRQPVYYQDFMASDKARREYRDQKLESWDTFRSARPNAVHYPACTLEAAGKLLMLDDTRAFAWHQCRCKLTHCTGIPRRHPEAWPVWSAPRVRPALSARLLTVAGSQGTREPECEAPHR